MIRVGVVGANGRMGRSVAEAVRSADGFEVARDLDGELLLDKGGDLARMTLEVVDVVVEFSIPDASFENVSQLVRQGVSVVVGTTGWTDERKAQLEEVLESVASETGTKPAVLIVPNFSLSAVLLEKFAAMAAPLFESVEVIEMHHPDKLDAPSGTAASTAAAIARARTAAGLSPSGPDATSSDTLRARGAKVDGVPVHAIRLRGLNAHEMVLFGNPGEQLEIRQDSFTRECFMPGVLKAVEAVYSGKCDGLEVGLGDLLFGKDGKD